MNYDQLYNGTGAHKKADDSWGRYMNPTDKNDQTRERYEASVSLLYGDVLDVGAGDGFGAYLMGKNGRITGVTCVEVDDEAIRRIKQNVGIDAVKSSVEEMRFDHKFDSIHCGHTLEHVEYLGTALENIRLHAKDRVIISVPIHGGLSHIHVREFNSVSEVWNMLDMYFDVITWHPFRKSNDVFSAVFLTTIK